MDQTALTFIIGGLSAAAASIGTWLATRHRVTHVDSVTAISQAYERILNGHDQQVELLKSLIGEQGKRIDALQTLVAAKDAQLADRDNVIRRLREHMDVYYHALIEAKIDAPAPPLAVIAPERRTPTTVESAAPMVAAAEQHHQ